jgi:hypothetical protein
MNAAEVSTGTSNPLGTIVVNNVKGHQFLSILVYFPIFGIKLRMPLC